MNVKKVIIIIILLFVGFVTTSNASSFSFNAEAQKEVFKPGEEVLVSLDVSNIEAGKEGINVVEMTLEYDENVFESMEFIKQNEWNSTYNNDKNSNKFGKILYTNISKGVIEAQKIGNIKFKLKDNLSDMETEIKLLRVTSNDGKELISEGDRIIKIKIVNDKETPKEPEKQEEPKQEIKKQEEVIRDIPQTGQTRVIYYIVCFIILCAVVSLIVIAISTNKKK